MDAADHPRPGRTTRDLLEVGHEAGSIISALPEEFADACRHLDCSPLSELAALPPGEPPVMHAARKMRVKHHFDCCLGPDEGEFPVPHARQEGQASSVIR